MRSRILIAGGGPAGSSLAIRLAVLGCDVTLVEREHFPRHKLCGEFISPECLRHFDELGVGDLLRSSGGERIGQTRFFDRRGRSFQIASGVLGGSGYALALSRHEMDRRLLDKAKAVGVEVLTGSRVVEATTEAHRVSSVTVASEASGRVSLAAELFIDATGRSLALSKAVERKLPGRAAIRDARQGSVAVAFKAHFTGARPAAGTCEIYAFPGGYGGLTRIEEGRANLCFLVKADVVKKASGNADHLLKEAVLRNERAAWSLENARPVRDWLAVSIGSFGATPTPSAENLFTVGDAASFIDPFTGSGMLMALQSSALLARCIAAAPMDPAFIRRSYYDAYPRSFEARLRVCSALRHIAFIPFLPTVAVSILRASRTARNLVVAATRSSGTASDETC